MEAAEILSETAIDSLQAGDPLGRYQLLCPIARGGMGQVWAARQTGRLGLPKLVAIKTALPLSTSSYESVQQFLFDEAQVAASIDHPNVCKILELGQDGGVLFIAMEWIHGAPLSTLVHAMPQRRFDYRIAAHIVAEACSGLHAAHELRDDEGVPLEVVHRDATPHNLLISAAGEVKVMDFGIVKSRNQQHQATQTGELKGKISYLAPEQIRGKGVDRRADIFTLGCVLYLITTGRNPFAAAEPGTTIMRILDGDYASPSTLVPDYPEELELIVTRALAKDVEDRYQTADELRVALESFMSAFTPSVTREEIAALLHQCCGAKIEQRRAEIRAAQKMFDSQGGGPLSSGTYPTGEARSWEHQTPVVSREASQAAAAPAQPPPLPEPSVVSAVQPALRPRWALRLGLAALVLGGAVAGAVMLRPALAPQPAVATAVAAGAPAAAPAPAFAAAPVRISVRANPATATLRIDDGPELSLPHSLSTAPDARPRVLRLSAPGHEETQQTVVFDHSQTLAFELLPERDASRAPRGVRRLATPRANKAPPAALEPPGARAPEPARAPTAAPKTSDTELRTRPRHTIDESDPFGN